MKKVLFRSFQVLFALVAVVASFAVTPVVIGVVNRSLWLGFATYFGAYMFLNGLILTIILPDSTKRDFAIPWLKRWFTVKEGRFDRGFWPRFKKRGPFALSCAAGVLFGPFFGTVVIRYLGIKGQQAWLYSFLITVISGVVSCAIYTGAFNLIKVACGCGN